MPRPMRGAAAPPPSIDPLSSGADDLQFEMDYFQMLKQAGARRIPGRGIVREAPVGAPFQRAGKWVQNTKTYPVAMSAEEARNQTRATGERWDYYEAGTTCKRCAEVGDGVISGWVLGGRKFQSEHDHVTTYDPSVYGVMEVEAPVTDEVADEARVLVEA